MSERLNIPGILLFYEDHLAPNANTIFEHLEAFQKYSQFPVYPLNVVHGIPAGLGALEFAVTAFHYTLGPNGTWITPEIDAYLSTRRQTYKVAIFQDEMWYFKERLHFLNRYAIDCLYTRHKPKHFDDIYGAAKGLKRRIHYRAGYVATDMVETAVRCERPLKDRPIDVAYRGRRLPYYLGRGAQEKSHIAERFLELARSEDLRLDIAVGEDRRLYGKAWHEFLANSKAMLGVEGGVSVIDLDGTFHKEYAELIKAKPTLTFEEFAERMGDRFNALEDRIDYRSVTPRVFEAAAFRNVQILFEGRYDDVLTPGVHYIPLRKDFANFGDVVAQLRDTDRLQKMVDRTWHDLIGSNEYSYQAFIRSFDEELRKAGVRFAAPDPNIDAQLRAYLTDWSAFRRRYDRATAAMVKAFARQPRLGKYLLCRAKGMLDKFSAALSSARFETYAPEARAAAQDQERRFWGILGRSARIDLDIDYPSLQSSRLVYLMDAMGAVWGRVLRQHPPL